MLSGVGVVRSLKTRVSYYSSDRKNEAILNFYCEKGGGLVYKD